ncbi:MAG: hypothetical protein FJ245_12195 [Nitrospira sp.]|nr:hypothetical protein [Nitrospira sp.]
MSKLLLICGGLVFVGMGLVHGLVSGADVLRPTQFTPVDDSVRLGMKSTTVRFLKARATVWDAWLGFNLSHSLGMLVFGAAAVWFGLNLERVPVSSAALAAPVVIGLLYLLLAVRFWFWAPAVSSAIATACFVAAWWGY